VRHRGSHHDRTRGDDWQLETLCNLAAAEFLMPVGTLARPMQRDDFRVDNLMRLRAQFEVSMEAVLIRAVRMSTVPCAVFAASRIEQGADEGRYRLEYLIPSRIWRPPLSAQTLLPPNTHVAECTAIAYTAKGTEEWQGERLHVEATGVPPYPWSSHPRVAGAIWPPHGATKADLEPCLTFLNGDALQPRGTGPRIVAHVVNDAAPIWGGQGFAAALRRRWPEVQRDFHTWATTGNLRLRRVRFFARGDGLIVASMVAQRGYGDAPGVRRLRYAALEECLDQVAELASQKHATVHMPRIGSGYGGAPWGVVQELITQAFCSRQVPVSVYSLPNAPMPPQPSLDFLGA
jgi:hypothetical protein